MPDRKAHFPPLPSDTARAARSVFNYENLYLVIGDQLDQLLADYNLEEIDPTSETPLSVVTLHTMITIFQFAHGLPDRQAAEATRTRMDWKYALHLPLHYPGLQPLSLCRFRQRLSRNRQGQKTFEGITNRLAAVGLLSRREKLGREAPVVLRTVCTATRLDKIAQAFNQALECLAARKPEWLRAIALPHWYKRYDGLSLAEPFPNSDVEQTTLARALGADAHHLLQAVRGLDIQAHRGIPEIQNLHRVFHDQFSIIHHNAMMRAEISWRPDACATCILAQNGPH